MQSLFIIVICIAVISVFVITAIQIHLKDKSKELTKKFNRISTYSEKPYSKKSSYEQAQERLSKLNNAVFVDIPTDLNNEFHGKIISATQEIDFTNRYKPYFQEAHSLAKKLEAFSITPSETISKLIRDFGNINNLIKQHNETVINNILDTHKEFFDHCLKYPLDKQQRRSIVSEEDNCLVISSAGSGKTSSIIGKVKYLIEIKGIDPKKILLISYTNKAASELTERMSIAGLKGYTFHKLAIDLIGQATGAKPSICDNTDALFVNIYHALLEDILFKKNVVEYFIDYQSQEADWEQRKNERREQLSEQKNIQLKALFPDMDGKTIYVRSEQEQKICFALSSLGVRFRYEEPYEHPLADEMHSQYKPDFSIYYEYKGESKRIYLEHFGIDEHGLVPVWFAKDKNITYEEANQKYNDGITWKKAAHEKFGTVLITTSSADFHYSDIKDKLKNMLIKAGVTIHEKTDAELYNSVLPKDSKQEKAFIRLVSTFITLIKSSCKSIEDILHQANRANDERSVFIIKNIFYPVHERYINALRENNQIDFTDVILQATEICYSSHPVEYDYIIVDEFQDISVDRYNFLKALRKGNPPAKLYCVGDDWQSIYRFSGSDMALFSQFPDYFGATEINKIETTYRFGEPLVALSSQFVKRNNSQIKKDIHSFSTQAKTDLVFRAYERKNYCDTIGQIIAQIPLDKSIFLLGRYSFDDYYLSFMYQSIKRGNKFFYIIGGREIEFLTVHKSKGLEADYVIILQCNKDTYGFPSLVSDDPVLNYVLTKSDTFPFGEERRLFYVAITRAKIRTIVLYDNHFPSVFVNEFLHPELITEESCSIHPNANKRWTRAADQFLLRLHHEGKSIKYIAAKMGRSQTSIVMRLGKLNQA
ncbi:UvrD-helicase domain-containing protein [Bacteroides sp. AN502(2024)]|uniref:UvrD-helicase domain-containing protein n=1 Tax=Bacteroides sp. AN502(2024) TaxID=3160599 RepID=UPI003518C0EC